MRHITQPEPMSLTALLLLPLLHPLSHLLFLPSVLLVPPVRPRGRVSSLRLRGCEFDPPDLALSARGSDSDQRFSRAATQPTFFLNGWQLCEEFFLLSLRKGDFKVGATWWCMVVSAVATQQGGCGFDWLTSHQLFPCKLLLILLLLRI